MDLAPAISIIMPCYNDGARLPDAIHSVEKQSFRDFEIIVVNDGSTDNSPDVLARFSDELPYLRVLHQANQGASAARNRGLKEARGRYIAFLDADDTWSPDFLEKMHQALESHPQAALAYCGWQNLGIDGKRSPPFVPPDYEASNKVEIFLEGCRWPIHGALTRKKAIEEIGGFDTALMASEDYDLWLRIATFHPIVLVPSVLAYYHHHEGEQLTKNQHQLAVDHLAVQEKFLRQYPWIRHQLGTTKCREILYGGMNARALRALWDRDLKAAHKLFRILLRKGYLNRRNFKYAIPSLLPFLLYRQLVGLHDSRSHRPRP